MTWGDLDKLGVAKPRPDGGPTLVATDERALADLTEAKWISILVAMTKVARGRHVLAERYGDKGAVAYVTRGTPPAWLIEAVCAAGGVLFDGAREHAMPIARAATMILDETFCDLAIAVRRRLKMRTFEDALELRERELRKAPVTLARPLAYWTATFELMAVAGEIIRADHAGRYVLTPTARIPIALDMGKERTVLLGRAAEAIAQGDAASLTTLVASAAAWFAPPVRPTPRPVAHARVVPKLFDRTRRPPAQLTWEPLLPATEDHAPAPGVAYVPIIDDALTWITLGALTDELRTRARASLDLAAFELDTVDLGAYQVQLITGDHASEALLHPSTMQRLVLEVGSDELLVSVPLHGHLFAIAADAPDDVQHAFRRTMERLHSEATEDERLAPVLLVYRDGSIAAKPPGRAT